jgi:23S rRNA (cytidine2498-2'-O)-methyltransferase
VARLDSADFDRPAFFFMTCQVGAEPALKGEIARRWPAFHFAYSRPGFLTFKLPPGPRPGDDLDLASVFARSYGFVLAKVSGEDLDARARQVASVAGQRGDDALHVWQRDTARPGHRGFEPRLTVAALEAEAAIGRHVRQLGRADAATPPRVAKPGQMVLDCVMVDPESWWVGYHRARDGESCFPGGLREMALPDDAVSRAWLKMQEALAWSALPMRRGQRVVELGCAPGGASQALLAHGLTVIGVDPAQVDPRVAAHPNFQHVRKRADDVRRREFRGIAWLAADMNVAPQTALDTVEAIVTHESTNFRGLLLTLKLLDWSLAELVDEYLERVRGWGYRQVRARQLAHNRQEICVMASERRAARRSVKQRP